MIDIRDEFALVAMKYYLSMGMLREKVSQLSYSMADSMMVERSKNTVDERPKYGKRSSCVGVGFPEFFSKFETLAVVTNADKIVVIELLNSVGDEDREEFLSVCKRLQDGLRQSGLNKYGAEKLVRSSLVEMQSSKMTIPVWGGK